MPREGSPSDTGLYEALMNHLAAADRPLTCVDLYDERDVKQKATDVNMVSNALGHLWRRDYIKREPAPRTPLNQAKWAYYIPDGAAAPGAKHRRTLPAPPLPAAIEETARTLVDRPSMKITDDGNNIEIELPNFTISIRSSRAD